MMDAMAAFDAAQRDALAQVVAVLERRRKTTAAMVALTAVLASTAGQRRAARAAPPETLADGAPELEPVEVVA